MSLLTYIDVVSFFCPLKQRFVFLEIHTDSIWTYHLFFADFFDDLFQTEWSMIFFHNPDEHIYHYTSFYTSFFETINTQSHIDKYIIGFDEFIVYSIGFDDLMRKPFYNSSDDILIMHRFVESSQDIEYF